MCLLGYRRGPRTARLRHLELQQHLVPLRRYATKLLRNRQHLYHQVQPKALPRSRKARQSAPQYSRHPMPRLQEHLQSLRMHDNRHVNPPRHSTPALNHRLCNRLRRIRSLRRVRPKPHCSWQHLNLRHRVDRSTKRLMRKLNSGQVSLPSLGAT